MKAPTISFSIRLTFEDRAGREMIGHDEEKTFVARLVPAIQSFEQASATRLVKDSLITKFRAGRGGRK